jgi:hypothetical protein
MLDKRKKLIYRLIYCKAIYPVSAADSIDLHKPIILADAIRSPWW